MSDLDIAVRKRLGDFELDIRLQVEAGAVALFGASGSGKTTLVKMIAGLIRPDAGRIALGADVLFDMAAGIDQPAHRRRVGVVFQEGRLFPHLGVRWNLLFGRFMNGLPRDDAAFARIVALLDLAPVLARGTRRLSGGEQQRVAIGRALLAAPRLLLLDEPLASLDSARKREIIPYLRRLRQEGGVPMVYVSHAREEIERIADTIVHMGDGRVRRIEANRAAAAEP